MAEGRSQGSGARARIACGVVAAALLAALYWYLDRRGTLALLMDSSALRLHLARHTVLGPLLSVALMAGAIVFSPVPSAPIALATGAAYGHTWGTIYILVGAELGALIAFALARLLGRDAVHRWLGGRIALPALERQGTLMGIVFLSRLLPFISFDVVSYAAGLTALAPWRFALATLAGIAPASFLLAHFGSELASADPGRVLTTALLLGGVTLLPLLVKYLRGRRPGRPGPPRDA